MKLCVPYHCLSNPSIRKETEVPLSDPAIIFSLYSSCEEVPNAYWKLARTSDDYFLQKDYLQLLEDHLPGDFQFSYLLFFDRGSPIGIAYCQILEFRAADHITQQDTNVPFPRKILSQLIRLRVLLCGNMLLTGQHAYFFLPEQEANAGKLIREALDYTADHWRRKGVAINTILFKDVPDKLTATVQDWEQSHFHRLAFQPNMVLPIPPDWRNMEDYLNALSSKYRVRYRRAGKKLKGVDCHELSASQIRAYQTEIYTLYRRVADSADFRVAYLPENYFSELKTRAPRNFRLWGYFKQDQLIGFCTSLRNGNDLEAHFLGLGQDQQSYQLYLNMLYQLVEVAIESRAGRLVFSRTAMAIKSSVGAVPESTSVFLTHRTSKLIDHLIPYLVNVLEPKNSWKMRHPFRASAAISLDE